MILISFLALIDEGQGFCCKYGYLLKLIYFSNEKEYIFVIFNSFRLTIYCHLLNISNITDMGKIMLALDSECLF